MFRQFWYKLGSADKADLKATRQGLMARNELPSPGEHLVSAEDSDDGVVGAFIDGGNELVVLDCFRPDFKFPPDFGPLGVGELLL